MKMKEIGPRRERTSPLDLIMLLQNLVLGFVLQDLEIDIG